MDYKLFDTIERTETGPSSYSEPQFEYVNRTNRSHFQEVRAMLEEWFREYVTKNFESAKDLRARFRSKDNEHHLAALTELYLHHLLLVNGFLPSAHPDLHGITRKPEFYANLDSKPQFVVEAVLVYYDKIMSRVNKFEANIFDAIDAVNSPDFLINVYIESRDLNTQPKLRSITNFLQKKIDELDYNQVYQDYERSNKLPEWKFCKGNWKLEFTASPVTDDGRERRTADSRVMYVVGQEASLVNDIVIRDNLIAKSKKYGKFDIPFVIFVNVFRESRFCDDDTIKEVLFGREVTEYIEYKDGSHETRPRRELNGIWTDPKAGLTNLHVSGIIFISDLASATIETAKPVLWHHPNATCPFDMKSLDIEQRFVDKETGKLKKYNSNERGSSN